MGGADVSIRGQKTSITGITDVNVTDRVARILGQLTDGVNIIDPRDRNWTLSSITDSITTTMSGAIDVSDRANRLLGIVYGSQNQQLLQRAVTFDLQTQLRTNGIEYDARDRNWDLNFITDQVDVSGSTITVINAPTTPISDFDTDSNIAPGSSSTHTYTATGNFKLTSIQASASGAMKIEVKTGVSGSETTKMIAFTTESNLTIQLKFHEEIQITIGQRIQVIRTNREVQVMDVFSTILGFNN